MLRSLTAQIVRERSVNLMELSLAPTCGTEEKFEEKEQLFESLHEKIAERDMTKQATAAARRNVKTLGSGTPHLKIPSISSKQFG